MKRWWRRVRGRILPGPIYALASALGRTWKFETEGYEAIRNEPRSVIFAGWHGRTIVAAIFFRGQGVWTIISLSRDGEMQNRIFQRFGFNTVRGSTGREGVKALIECIRVLKPGGARMAFTPDGPRGPSGIVQDGIIQMAQKSGALVVPVGVSASRRWLVRSWDRFMVPKPFARTVMIFGEPIEIPKDAPPEIAESARRLLESELHRLEAAAEAKMGHRPQEFPENHDEPTTD